MYLKQAIDVISARAKVVTGGLLVLFCSLTVGLSGCGDGLQPEAGVGGNTLQVSAGSDQTITLPNTTSLKGTIGKHGGGVLKILWSKVSGPGNVKFTDAHALSTTAKFSEAGSYVVGLTVSIGAQHGSGQTTVTVKPTRVNQPLRASAGDDQTITLPHTASLKGMVKDDGLPDSKLSFSWSKVSGPGTVGFANAKAQSTTASFSTVGNYVLEFTASAGQLTGSDKVAISVKPAPSSTPPANQAPRVSAGNDQVIILPSKALLQGTIKDDRLPDGKLSVVWSKVSGPGTVSFADATAQSTTAKFSEGGSYVLKLTADDGQLSSSARVTITVKPPPAPPIEASAYYVSTNGDDSAAGTFNAPFRTIQHCAEVVTAGKSCIIRGGVYQEEVHPAHSGQPGSPITFKPYPGESVTISGAEVLTGWKHDTGHVYYANMDWDLGAGNNQVFVDGKMMIEARWPNTGLDLLNQIRGSVDSVTGSGSNYTLHDSNLPSGLKGAYVNIGLGSGNPWTMQTARVTSSSSGQITIEPVGDTLAYPPEADFPYFVWGKRSLLDAPGEWFYDADNQHLYLWLPGGGNPKDHMVEVKKRTLAFNLDGLSYVHLKDLDIFSATISTDEGSSNVVLEGLTVTYSSHFMLAKHPWGRGRGSTGIILHGSDNTLEDSIIAYSAGNGVTLHGSHQTVKNNVIHDTGYMGTDTAAVTMACTSCPGESSGHLVAYNTIYRTGRSAMLLRETKDSRVLHNDISYAGFLLTDLGMIYTWNTDGDGTEIAYNLIHDTEAKDLGIGIYLDNGSSNFIVHHNVIWNVEDALRLNLPSTDNLVINNTLLGSRYSVDAWGPKKDMTGTEIDNNLAPDGFHNISYGASRNTNLVGQNPKFQGPTKHNYMLQSSSPAIDQGVTKSPYTDGYQGSAPDLGAYEYGSAAWLAGSDLSPKGFPSTALADAASRYR
jgi:hypothetical protein